MITTRAGCIHVQIYEPRKGLNTFCLNLVTTELMYPVYEHELNEDEVAEQLPGELPPVAERLQQWDSSELQVPQRPSSSGARPGLIQPTPKGTITPLQRRTMKVPKKKRKRAELEQEEKPPGEESNRAKAKPSPKFKTKSRRTLNRPSVTQTMMQWSAEEAALARSILNQTDPPEPARVLLREEDRPAPRLEKREQ